VAAVLRRQTVRRIWAVAVLAAVSVIGGRAASADLPRFDGFNVIASPEHPFGTPAAKRALALARQLGANSVAIVPFLWQANATSPDVARGDDMSDRELRTAVRDAHALGLRVMVKPHVWIPGSWAGAVVPASEDDWRAWFANYRQMLLPIAKIAAEEGAEAFAVGTELKKTSHRPEWLEAIAAVRAIYPGTILYVAHNVEEAAAIRFWSDLDAIGVTLYPPLGEDDDGSSRRNVMRAVATSLDSLSVVHGKPVIVAEIGLRSAVGAAAKPWESAEERAAKSDPHLQADVLADWLAILTRPSVRGVMIWRWFTDPTAGGPLDTDFTVQGKPAEGLLLCAWTARCSPRLD
jgi:hypothetical protein